MREEVQRCRTALEHAVRGAVVSLVSSGDPGIYGMAGLALELAVEEGIRVPVTVVPGVSAANAAAARVGAPLMLDYACISLSDLLIDWSVIRRRLEAVAAADLAVVLYNPRSKKRVRQLEEAVGILRGCRGGTTPVAVATDVSGEDERIELTDLDGVLGLEVNMRSVVIVGTSSTIRSAQWMIAPRGYRR